MKSPLLVASVLLLVAAQAAPPLSFEAALAAEPGSRSLLENASVSIAKPPSNLEEFLAFRDERSGDPRGAAAAFVVAMVLYGKDKNLGLSCLTAVLEPSLLTRAASKPVWQGFAPKSDAMNLIRQLDRMPWLGGLYVEGTTAESGYALPEKGPWVIRFHQLSVDHPGDIRLYLQTTGGNLPRPLGLRKADGGVWKAFQISSLMVGPSRMPAAK